MVDDDEIAGYRCIVESFEAENAAFKIDDDLLLELRRVEQKKFEVEKINK